MIAELLQRGGPALWLLLACSVLGGAITLERLLFFHRTRIDIGQFLRGLAVSVRQGEFGRAVQECAGTPGPAARVLRAALANRHQAPTELREIVREATRLELPPTERYLHVLFAVVMVAPLIGLLGTVMALLGTFGRLAESGAGLVDSMQLFEGMYQALLTTGVGIAVAIPLYIAYNYLAASARSQLREVERAGVEIIHLLGQQSAPPSASAPDTPRGEDTTSASMSAADPAPPGASAAARS